MMWMVKSLYRKKAMTFDIFDTNGEEDIVLRVPGVSRQLH